MSAKKNTFRFTVQLNGADAHHIRVAEILNGQGRHKAQFIVNAIMHSENCNELISLKVFNSNIDSNIIEAIVEKALRNRSNEKTNPEVGIDVGRQSARSDSENNEYKLEDTDKELGEDTLSVIAGSVNAFRANNKPK